MSTPSSARPSGEPGIRIPVPAEMLDLPLGLRPVALRRDPKAPLLHLVHPGDVVIGLDLLRLRVAPLRRGEASSGAARRLAAALQRRIAVSAALRRWLAKLAAWRPGLDASGADLAAPFQAALDGQLEAVIARATQPPAAAASLAAPSLLRAWALAVAGRGAEGWAVLESLGEVVRVDPRHALAVGQFAAAFEDPAAGIEPLSRAVHLLGEGHGTLLALATEVGDRSGTLLGLARRLKEAERDPEPRDQLVHALLAGDAGDEALRLAERWLEAHEQGGPPDPGAALRLAELELYRGHTARALELAGRSSGTQPLRDRVRGAAAVLEGRPSDALEPLERAVGAGELQARFWLAQARADRDEGDEARRVLLEVPIAGQPALHLLEGLLDAMRGELFDDTRYVFPRQVRALGVPFQAGAEGAALDRDAIVHAAREALARLGGNRGRPATLVEGDTLRRVPTLAPRVAAERLQRSLLHRPVEAVLETFLAQQRADPGLPYPYTYGAEILLWTGDYDRAFELLVEAWERFETRWAYIGAGAAEAMRGRPEAALEWWRKGEAAFGLLDAEATHAYRGEVWRRLGELDRAKADLEHALHLRPGRHGSRLDLARTLLEAGREAEGASQLRRLAQVAPFLIAEARLDAGVGEGALDLGDLGPSPRAEVLARAAHMLRGNRSSKLLTFVDREGRFRVFAEAHVERWRRVATRVEFLPHDAQVQVALSRGEQGE